jgi:hypothetical protein
MYFWWCCVFVANNVLFIGIKSLYICLWFYIFKNWCSLEFIVEISMCVLCIYIFTYFCSLNGLFWNTFNVWGYSMQCSANGEAVVPRSNYCPGICLEWLQKPWFSTVRTDNVTALVLSKHFQNVIPEHYWCTLLLSACSILFRRYLGKGKVLFFSGRLTW